MTNIVAIYDYVDEHHTILYQAVRLHPKEFRQRRILHDGTYVWGISAGEYRKYPDGDYYRKRHSDPKNTVYTKFPSIKKHVPYRLPKLLHEEFTLLVEGEKDVESAEKIHYMATTNSGGVANFQKDIATYFQGKYVAIIADNDTPGHIGAVKRAHILQPYAKHIKVILSLPLLSEHQDITDWIELQSHTTVDKLSTREQSLYHNELYHIINKHPTWTPSLTDHIYSHDHKKQYIYTKQRKKTINTIYDFIQRIKGAYLTMHNHWQAQCPAHNDDVNSLSITLKHNKILIYCFAGCHTSDILKAINLSWKDLYL